MTVCELIGRMHLTPLTTPTPRREITGGYVGDLLSWVMGHARSGQVWITVISDINAVAVASLADVACVVLTDGTVLSEEVRRAAEQRGVCVLSTPMTSYEAAAALSVCLAE